MFSGIDLHTHTQCSDGTLSPLELWALACESDVKLLAITDHDTVDAFEPTTAWPPVSLVGSAQGPTLIPGVELSTSWHSSGCHIVGLNIDPAHDAMQAAVTTQREVRADRAKRIAAALVRSGLPDLYPSACERAGHHAPGRPHFAKSLVAGGHSRDEKHAFRRHLGKGRPGNVKTPWADLSTVIEWIHAAGGLAVLAHPARYPVSKRLLEELIKNFKEAQGDALEFISGRQDRDTTARIANFLHRFDLLASAGSDFHSPSQTWLRLGVSGELPGDIEAVWTRF